MSCSINLTVYLSIYGHRLGHLHTTRVLNQRVCVVTLTEEASVSEHPDRLVFRPKQKQKHTNSTENNTQVTVTVKCLNK